MKVDYEWQRPYLAAVLETDRAKLTQRIAVAHAAIQARTGELSQGQPASTEELTAIEMAVGGLKLLSKEVIEQSSKSKTRS
jgi:hypothetical protein